MKKTLVFVFAFAIISMGTFIAFEGVVVGAEQHSTGTTQALLDQRIDLTVTAEYALTCPDNNITMPSISGISGGTSEITATCTPKTNDTAGYSLKVAASTTPAMRHDVSPTTYDFDDYTHAGSADYVWALTSSATSEFGFAVSSTDVVAAFKNDGAACNAGTNISNDNCFRGYAGATLIPVASRATVTDLSGIPVVFRWKAQVGVASGQATGLYHATSTVTVTANP